MSVRLRLLLFGVGLALAALVVSQVGVAVLLAHLRATGWLLLPVVVIWGVVYLLDAMAWYTLLGLEASRPGFFRAWSLHVSSFILNHITPLGGMGGEGYRAYSLAPWLGQRRAVAAVVQFRLLTALAHMAFILASLIPGAVLLPWTAPGITALAITGLFGVTVGWFLHRRHQEGILEAGLDLLLALPGVRRLARRFESRRSTLRTMDQQITELYRRHPGRFWRAIGLEFLGRCLMAMEYAVIFWGLGLGVRIPEAFIATALSTTIINLLFFLPMELGSREGGLYLVFSLLGLGTEHGVFAAVVTRLRELTWTAIGLLLIWGHGGSVVAGRAEEPGAGPTEAGP